MSNEITEVTRRAIFDNLTASHFNWSGRLSEDDFLSRLYNLNELPSTDRRHANAAGDINLHRNVFSDWGDDWIFYDSRFDLLHDSDENFCRFLCETVHPNVRIDPEQARQKVDEFNGELKADGWVIREIKQISERPVFGAFRLDARVEVFEEPTGWQKVDRQLQEVKAALDKAKTEEQYQTVGLLCRESLITVAQELYHPELHGSPDDKAPSKTDAKRMLEALFAYELKGGVNQEARSHARAAVDLALALQHKRTADFRMAALCAEATATVVNLLSILAGRRGRSLSA